MQLEPLISHIRSVCLPGIVAHKEMSFTNRNFEKNPDAIKGAVAIVLFEHHQQIFFPLIKRTNLIRHHKGQIALPGGKIDEGENIMQCAIREANEEIGIPTQNIHFIRQLTELYIPVSNYLVYPVVCVCYGQIEFLSNPTEVEKVILCSVNDLIKFERQVFRVKINEATSINAPGFIYQEEVIWGATALILNELRHIILQWNK